MRRRLVLPLLLLLFIGVATAVTQAQDDPPPLTAEKYIVVEQPLAQAVDASITFAAEARRIEGLRAPLHLTADDPADMCAEASQLLITPEVPADGNASSVIDATSEGTDPRLECMWDNPPRLRGYRTVWYQLVAPASGTITLDTFNSGYDTVVGVFTGSCGNLQPVHCNDDSNGFTSQTSVIIQEGETYYVEVADYRPGLVPDPTLQLSAVLEPVTSQWKNIVARPANYPISRHAVVSQGQFIYIVGGKTGGTGVTQYTNELRKYDTIAGRWVEEGITQMPGVGYANTTAVLFNNRIYLPTGDIGSPLAYSGNHWAYNILTDSWEQLASIPREILPDGRYFAYASAVVPPIRNRYYVTGGLTSLEPLSPTANVSAEAYVYFPGTNSWARQKPMQAARYAHTAGWIETNNLGICVAGGLGTGVVGEGEPVTILHRSVECYQPGGNWRFMGDLNVPRYGAGSVVGPDGNWYVFGGITFDENGLQTVARTEVYNPRLNTWTVMDASYNLGTYRTMPPRYWPRGAMVGSDLWVVGGSIFNEGEEAVPVMDRLRLASDSSLAPVMFANYSNENIPDDAFPTARHMGFGGMQRRNFDAQRDFFDYYYFDLYSSRRVNITLEVPDGNNFDLELYGQQKMLWETSANPLNGIDESISVVLAPRRYYIRVIRTFPTEKPDKGAYYTLRLN